MTLHYLPGTAGQASDPCCRSHTQRVPTTMCDHWYKLAPVSNSGRPHTTSIATSPNHTTPLVRLFHNLHIQYCWQLRIVWGVHVMWPIAMHSSHHMPLYNHMYTCGTRNVQCICTLAIRTPHEVQWMHRIRTSWCPHCTRLRNPFVECKFAQIRVWGHRALGQIGTHVTKRGASRGQVADLNRRYSSPFRCVPLHCRGGPRLHGSYILILFNIL